MPAKKCSKGKIARKSYTRTPGSKQKNSFARTQNRTGKKVYVKSACVPDTGKPGKTPKKAKILPKLGNKLHLSNYGYELKQNAKNRRASLSRASSDNNPITVLRRLNLIRNYTAVEKNKAKLSSDVKWMSNKYTKSKSRKSKNNKK